MIIGIGVDIAKVARFDEVLERYGERFVERILHPSEQEKYQIHSQPLAFFAKRFAAKEALAKALGTGIAKGVNFNEIEVRQDENGKPFIVLHDSTREVADQMGVKNLFLSLSDEQDYAVANVVLEG